MTENDFDRTARLWLEDGPTVMSDRALLAALDEIHVTRQRRAWWPARRQPDMNSNIVRLGLAAAAVVALVFVGMRFLPPPESVGVPPSESAPIESAAGSSPSPAPSPIGSPIPLHSGPLVPGTYFIGPDLKGLWMECPPQPIPGCSNTMRLMFTVPDRWAGVGGNSIWPDLVGNAPPDGAGMLFTRGGWLRSDPCVPFAADASPGALVEVPGDFPVDIPVGPTVDDFATALADHPLLDTTPPTVVSLAGYSGKYMDLQVPLDISACPVGYQPWDGNIYAQGPGHRWHLWILDVDGQRVVVEATDYAGTSERVRVELQAIVDSVVIEP
jgi:hypothetical protein